MHFGENIFFEKISQVTKINLCTITVLQLRLVVGVQKEQTTSDE